MFKRIPSYVNEIYKLRVNEIYKPRVKKIYKPRVNEIYGIFSQEKRKGSSNILETDRVKSDIIRGRVTKGMLSLSSSTR